MLRSRSAIQRATFARKTYLLNCHSQNPELLAPLASQYLWGTHKAVFHPHQDTGDNLILINTRHVQMEGNKWEEYEVEEFAYKLGDQRLVYRDLHLLDPTKVVRTEISKIINTPPDLTQVNDNFHMKQFGAFQHKHKMDFKKNYVQNWVWLVVKRSNLK